MYATKWHLEYNRHDSQDSNQILLNDKDQQVPAAHHELRAGDKVDCPQLPYLSILWS